eukprot:GCRY01002725.1.p2 GENE.GCRY01002725.1~~GCRY01002725.1.p2  ORF type:complete len:164 (+),score=56.01 GCRY01002725.1:393-884(+)
MKARKKCEMENLKKSGCEEEYEEREMLIDEVIDLSVLALEAHANNKKLQRAEELKEQGEKIRSAAMESLSNSSEFGEPPCKRRKNNSDFANSYVQVNEMRIELEKQKLALREKELELKREKEEEERAMEKERRKEEREERNQQLKMMQDIVFLLVQQNQSKDQ